MLAEVRARLLSEAKSSPGLLADLAGLEEYVAESYQTRAFVEFVQNADDAESKSFLIEREKDALILANNGHAFTASEFESLCRSAASVKVRGDAIGYRGIGFKSVVSVANNVSLYSAELKCRFSRTLTAQALPDCRRVPLIRVPHPVGHQQHVPIVQRLAGMGFTTVFILEELNDAAVDIEFSKMNSSVLLFLRHIRNFTIGDESYTVAREAIDDGSVRVRMHSKSSCQYWSILSGHGVDFALRSSEAGRNEQVPAEEAVVHAFLPTEEPVGLPIKVNGDFSTDPSRTRILLDDRTSRCTTALAQTIVQRVESALADGDTQLLEILTPNWDVRLGALHRKAFRSDLVEALRTTAKSRTFGRLRFCPAWLNVDDFFRIKLANGLKHLRSSNHTESNFRSWLKLLGVVEAEVDDFSEFNAPLSPFGAAQFITKTVSLNRSELIERLWMCQFWYSENETPCTLPEILSSEKSLDQGFVDLLTELGILTSIKRILVERHGERALSLFPKPPVEPVESISHPTIFRSGSREPSGKHNFPLVRPALKRWRTSEEHVLTLLNSQGWQLADVSKQNLGYDLSGTDDLGADVFVEVKQIEFPGQPFTLTTNEEAVARLKGNLYCIVIVKQTPTDILLSALRNPSENLQMVRQCRQWVWQCDSYPFEPISFAFD